MKKIRVLTIILCILLVLCALCGCSREDTEANARLEAHTRGMLDALMVGDVALAYDFVKNAATEEAFLPVYEEMRGMLSGVSDYSLRKLGTNRDGTEYAVSFLVTANAADGERSYAVTAYEKQGVSGMSAFLLQRNEDKIVPTGAITNMKDAGALSWVALVIGGVSWVFTLIAAIDCGRCAKKNKGIMLFLILFGMASFSFTLSPAFSISLVHGYYAPYTALLYYPEGEVVAQIFLPLGAIGYFLLRKKFVHPEE